MNRFSHRLTAWVRSSLLIASASVAATGLVYAAGAPAAKAGAPAQMSPGASHGAASPAHRTYTTVAGDTADRIVKKTMADIPLKDEILREALIQANPQVFAAGAKTRLKPGTALALPDPHPLLRQVLLPVLEPREAGAYFPPPPVSVEERRRWVRFP